MKTAEYQISVGIDIEMSQACVKSFARIETYALKKAFTDDGNVEVSVCFGN
jgi:hypothetical protein